MARSRLLRNAPTQPNVLRVAGMETYSDPEAAFAAAVRDGRSNLRLTQEQVRRRLLDGFGIDLSKTAMSRLEQGERPIRLNEVAALAKILGIDLRLGGQEIRESANERKADEEEVRRELAAVDNEVAVASATFHAARATAEQAGHRLAELRQRREALLDVVARIARGDVEILDMIRIAKHAREEAERNGQH
jgi:transcriptional regulator with XRE-family HTH domain